MADVVPFGKYRGQPVEVMMADAGYRDWAMAQPWFREKYPAIHQFIINYTGEPAETPEHNAMQASFLDDALCLRLARLLLGAQPVEAILPSVDERWQAHLRGSARGRSIGYRQFEVDGWDVTFQVKPAYTHLQLEGTPACSCTCDHSACPRGASCNGGEQRCWHAGHEEDRLTVPDQPRDADRGHCDRDCAWRARGPSRGYYVSDSLFQWLRNWDRSLERPAQIFIELKPDIGDDFPAVLRQVSKYPAEFVGGRVSRVVVARRHGFERVTWDQVVEMFAASNVTLISESLLADEP